MAVTKAIIPAAGRGSRLAPISHSIPKELLCVGAVPLIEWALRHCLAAAITEVAIVISPDKPLLRHYVEQLGLPVALHWIEQPQPLGSGEALWRCRQFAGSDPCVIYMPDEWALKPELSRLICCYRGGVSLLLSWVTPDWAAYLPGVGRIRYQDAAEHHSKPTAVQIQELLPKVATPFPAAPDGSFKGVGIGIVPPAFFAHLDQRHQAWRTQRDSAPEFDDVATWQAFAAIGELWGYRAESLIIDAGNPVGLAAANRYWLEHQR